MTGDRFQWAPELAAAMTSATAQEAVRHLLRRDGQEDICFALWHPSSGARRSCAVVRALALPRVGERNVHGNADFTSTYFLRAAAEAAAHGAGLALLHSHPGGHGWQALSHDDYKAEAGHAAQASSITGLPLLGITLAGDTQWSARLWNRTAARVYEPTYCRTVRTVGDRLRVSFDPATAPRPSARATQTRSVSAWGADIQADLARLRVGVVGAGSVGALIAESLARIGVGRVSIIDFDTLELHNLDRQLHSSTLVVGGAKAAILAENTRHSATAADATIDSYEYSVCEPAGFARALDCDVLFSCVDRPWPRAVLNLIAYAHLVPVIDGGIFVDARGGRFRGADWRAHAVAPGRRCLECLGQFDPGLVQAERDGFLDEPAYIQGLPTDHQLRRNENVFAFSVGCAGLELAQFICMVAAPSGIADPGPQHYNLATGVVDRDDEGCKPTCPYTHALQALADDVPVRTTGQHRAAELARARRQAEVMARSQHWVETRSRRSRIIASLTARLRHRVHSRIQRRRRN
jgi:molybdopterin-synthase adenylyltransferase